MEHANIHSQAVLSDPPLVENGERGLAASLERMKTEAAKLLGAMPHDHHMRNDAEALVFMLKLHERGLRVNLAAGQRCLERMRSAAETGRYPIEPFNAE